MILPMDYNCQMVLILPLLHFACISIRGIRSLKEEGKPLTEEEPTSVNDYFHSAKRGRKMNRIPQLNVVV